MPQRQRPISITAHEREFLERQRERYEREFGELGNWGDFLGAISLLGLVALGAYFLVRASERSAQTATVVCSQCRENILMAIPSGTPRFVQVGCPHCGQGLVVDLRSQ